MSGMKTAGAAIGCVSIALLMGVRRLLNRTRRRATTALARQHLCTRQRQRPAGVDCGKCHELRQLLHLPALTSVDVEELQRGQQVQKQVREGAEGWGFVVVDINAPADVVFDLLQDFRSYPDMIPVVRDAEVVSRTSIDGLINARCKYKISKFFLSISAVHEVDTHLKLVRFGLDPAEAGLVLREATGLWYVEPCAPEDGGCRVWFRASIKASALVPQWLLDYAAERALRKATKWLKPFAEQLWDTKLMLKHNMALKPDP